MCKNQINQCRSGKDFIRYAEKHGAIVQPAAGSHFKIKTDNGMCIVPCHNEDLGIGLRSKIIKLFLAIGLTIFIGWCFINGLAYVSLLVTG